MYGKLKTDIGFGTWNCILSRHELHRQVSGANEISRMQGIPMNRAGC
jgi:hypothetical protein